MIKGSLMPPASSGKPSVANVNKKILFRSMKFQQNLDIGPLDDDQQDPKTKNTDSAVNQVYFGSAVKKKKKESGGGSGSGTDPKKQKQWKAILIDH